MPRTCVVCSALLWRAAATRAGGTFTLSLSTDCLRHLTPLTTMTAPSCCGPCPLPSLPKAAQGSACAWARSGQGGRHGQLHRGGKRHSQGGGELRG